MSLVMHARQPVVGPSEASAIPVLLGIGTAVPHLKWTRPQTIETLESIWNLNGPALDRWRRIVEGTHIDTRHSVVSIESAIRLTTGQRMSLYQEHAPPLAVAAANRALHSAGISPDQITDLIVVSCTGFSAPGLDVELIIQMGLARTVRRTMVGFMGCFGGISGLRTAVGSCAANPGAVALVVCCELCSLHVRPDPGVQNQVATALFADGAAAAVVASMPGHDHREVDFSCGIGRLNSGASLLLDQGRDWMTWRITDAGFAMTLTREVPQALRESLADFVNVASAAEAPRSFIVHPGGPGILDAADAALDLHGGRGLQASREVLRRVGNVSSATVLFVLEESLRQDGPLPAMMLAFGPGLTIESMSLSA